MAQLTAQTVTRAAAGSPQRILVHRRGTVYVEPGPDAVAGSEPGVRLLEADLLDLGWMLDAGLRDALVRLDPASLVVAGATVLADCAALLGADRPHVPLFRNFPDSTPHDTMAFFVDRVLAAWFQRPGQPCVLCGEQGSVAPVNPCGHLVCRTCFDGADFSACPICHRRIDLADPFLRGPLQEEVTPGRKRPKRPATRKLLRVLCRGATLAGDAREEIATLLARGTALSPADADDLLALLDTQARDDLSWVPLSVPGRETKARLLAWLLRTPTPAAFAIAGALVDTATDVLRLLAAYSGDEPSLIGRSAFAPIPRPLRRHALAWLDRIAVTQLVQDMRRHERHWVRAGERLHPGEFVRRYPTVFLAFACIRRTPGGNATAALPDGATLPEGAEVRGGLVRVASRASQVERALADSRPAAAAALLHPGELARRLDHLLRIGADADQTGRVLDALAGAAPQIAPAVLLSALGQLRTRTSTAPARVYFPATVAAVAHVAEDSRPLLGASVVHDVIATITGELGRRAAALPPVASAVIDAELDTVMMPFAVRTASRALVTLPRGSVLALPTGRVVRLFCHWLQPDHERVDLDLSVAFFDADWQHVNTCDYTHLRVKRDAAVHSGDLTSAPPPLGASEFVDLDVGKLVEVARYAVMTVFSFNNVPFVDLPEAFAGWMVRDTEPGKGKTFDARAVQQRFDLTGPSRATLPLVIDLRKRTARWLDVAPMVTGENHAVHRHANTLARAAAAMTATFASGSRLTAGEVARLIAAHRTDTVLIRRDGAGHQYRRRTDETARLFAERLAVPDARDGIVEADRCGEAGLQVLYRADLPAPAEAEVYALHTAPQRADGAPPLALTDLLTALAPTTG